MKFFFLVFIMLAACSGTPHEGSLFGQGAAGGNGGGTSGSSMGISTAGTSGTGSSSSSSSSSVSSSSEAVGGGGGGSQMASSSSVGGAGGVMEASSSSSSGCSPKSCQELGKDCGPASDGCGSSLDCGSCPVGKVCGGSGTSGVCGGCTPKTCESEGIKCGLLEDGCGNTLDCGAYKRWVMCDAYASPEYNCHCPQDTADKYYSAWTCENGWSAGSPSPPGKHCSVNMATVTIGMIGYGWCCEESI